MAEVVEVAILPGTGRFDPDDQRWRDQVGTLHTALREDAGKVAARGVPAPGYKGAVDAAVLALGSSGALTAAVACFRAWLGRDKSRTLTVSWTDESGTEHKVQLTGENIDPASLQLLTDGIRQLLGEK